MHQPEALKTDEPMLWSPGTGVQVWEMFRAAATGDLPALERLLDADPALIRCHYVYRQPLYFAVRENQLAAARLLLERGADPLSGALNDSLVDVARDRGYAEMEQLLESHLEGTLGISPEGERVAAAIRARDLPEVRRLLDAQPHLLHAGDVRSNRPIHWATMTRQLGLIDELLARGEDIDAKRADNARPIHLFNGDYHYRGWRDVPKDVTTSPDEVLSHLIERGAYVDICIAALVGNASRVAELLDDDPALANSVSAYSTYYAGSGTPLNNAVSGGHIDVVKLLLERGADPNLREEGLAPKGQALYTAVTKRHYDIAKLLLDHGAFPNPPVESSADALTIALSHDDKPMIELLCSYGAARSLNLLAHSGDIQTAAAVFDANPALANDPQALSTAASNGHEAFIKLMLRFQPDLATRIAPDHYWMVGAKTREVQELLFARGMNPHQPDWLGITPLHHFAKNGDIERASLFIDHGANIHARDEDICSTPLAWAAKFGKADMVKFLLERGAQRELPDDPAWATPLAWAKRRGHADIVHLLQNGAH